MFATSRNDANLLAVRHPELLVIMAVDKANAFGGVLKMIIQPLTLITVAVNVIHTSVRIQTK